MKSELDFLTQSPCWYIYLLSLCVSDRYVSRLSSGCYPRPKYFQICTIQIFLLLIVFKFSLSKIDDKRWQKIMRLSLFHVPMLYKVTKYEIHKKKSVRKIRWHHRKKILRGIFLKFIKNIIFYKFEALWRNSIWIVEIVTTDE